VDVDHQHDDLLVPEKIARAFPAVNAGAGLEIREVRFPAESIPGFVAADPAEPVAVDSAAGVNAPGYRKSKSADNYRLRVRACCC